MSDAGRVEYCITVQNPGDGLPVLDAEGLALLDSEVRRLASIAFGPGVQIDRTIFEPNDAERGMPEIDFFSEKVQAKLDQPLTDLLNSEALGFTEPKEKHLVTRITNLLGQKGVITGRQLFLLGNSVLTIPHFSDANHKNLQHLLRRTYSEMSRFSFDQTTSPEQAAQFCPGLSHIQLKDVPRIFQQHIDHLRYLPDISLAEFKAQYMQEGETVEPEAETGNFVDNVIDYAREYIFRFEAAKRAMATEQGQV